MKHRALIFDQCGADNRVGYIVSLSAVRFMGFVPHDIAQSPPEALPFVAGQVHATRTTCWNTQRLRKPGATNLPPTPSHLGYQWLDDTDHEQLTSAGSLGARRARRSVNWAPVADYLPPP